MAKLLMPREEVKRTLELRIRAGNDLTSKAKVAEKTARYCDWLHLFETWREETIGALNRLYEGTDIEKEFAIITEVSEQSSPRYTFPYAKSSLEYGIYKLHSLIDRLELAVGAARDATAIESLHPPIYSGCSEALRE